MKKLLCVSVFSFLQCGDGCACSIPVPGVNSERMHLKEELNVSEVLNALSGDCPILPSVGTSSQIANGNAYIRDVFWDAMHAITGYIGKEEKSIFPFCYYLRKLNGCEPFEFMKSFFGKALSSSYMHRVLTAAYSKMTGVAPTTPINIPFYSPNGTCGAKEYSQRDVRYIFSGIKRRLDRLDELEQSGNSNEAEYTAGKMQIAKLMGLLIQGYNESPAEIYAAHTACVSDLLQSEKLDNIPWHDCLKALVLDTLLETRGKLFKFAILKHAPRYIDNIFDSLGIKSENIEAYAENCMAELGVHQFLEGMYGINAPQGNPFTDTYPETRQALLIYLLNARSYSGSVRRALFALAVNPKTKKWGPSGAGEFSWHGEPLTKKNSSIGYVPGGLYAKQQQYDADSLVSATYRPVAFAVTHNFVSVEPSVSFPHFSTHSSSSSLGSASFFHPMAPSLLPPSPDSPPFAPALLPSSSYSPPFAPASPVFALKSSFGSSLPFGTLFGSSLPFGTLTVPSLAPSLLPPSSSSSNDSPLFAAATTSSYSPPFAPASPVFALKSSFGSSLPFGTLTVPSLAPSLLPPSPDSPPFAPSLLPPSPDSPPFAPSLLPPSPDSPPFAPSLLPPSPDSPPFAPALLPSSSYSPPFAPASPVFALKSSFGSSLPFGTLTVPSLAPSLLPPSSSSSNDSPLFAAATTSSYSPPFAPASPVFALKSSFGSSLPFAAVNAPLSSNSSSSSFTYSSFSQPVVANMTVAEYKDVLKQLFRGVVGDTLSMVNLLLNSPLAERAINRYLGQDCTSLQELSSNIKCSTNWHNTGSHVKEMKVNLLTVMLVKAGMMNGNFSYTGGCI